MVNPAVAHVFFSRCETEICLIHFSPKIAPNGRTFFIDHNEKKTSWIDPRTGRASPMPSQTRPPEDDLGPLPEGWEERVHADGRIFFIDHSESLISPFELC